MQRLLAFAAAICLVSPLPAWARHPFPTEAEVQQTLRPGMTKGEVTALFGQPSGANENSYTYFAGIGLLRREEPGYAGFMVYFRDGRLSRWEAIINNPSYDPEAFAAPPVIKWWAWSWPLMFVSAVVIGIFRGFKFLFNEHRRVVRAFMGMKIPTAELPSDFAFITHDTTVLEVIERAGAPSRVVDYPVSESEVLNYPLITARNGASALRMLQYDLPYLGTVMILPEYPGDSESVIRAVYYRRPRADELYRHSG